MQPDASRFPIVGIGASAGGVQALEEFFKAFAADSGLSFVIITHLSPDRESLLHEIIERCTPMTVVVAQDRMRVAVNHVYVMPANAILTIEGSGLRIRKPSTGVRERNPIDIFFASLALYCGERAVGMILSGGGADGTLGIKAIKENGGLTMGQTADLTAPMHADMPRSAIAAGMVDHAVPTEDMPSILVAFQRSLTHAEPYSIATAEDDTGEYRKAVYDVLRKQTGHDFSGYKSKTFMRRIQRRMQINQTETIQAYIQQLDTDQDEVNNLFRDLLINVTNFFRDLDAFETLATSVIPKLFEDRGADDTVRVWVPGCATGEEVFSIGMLLREHMDRLKIVPRVQIFATDIDDPVLAVARAARYPEPLLENVSSERKRRFFLQNGETFTVSKEIRDLCIFSPHSVIRDPPFSRIDLVSCRNLLIYFGTEVQNQVIPIFHYSLKPGGYLFLGTSENVGQFSELFVSVDKKQRIFQARDHGAAKRLPAAMYGTRAVPFVFSQTAAMSNVPLRHLIEARVLERFSPAHVVINADGDVVYCSQRTSKYLEVPYGPPSRQIMAMARKGLRLDLRSGLHEVIESGHTVVRDRVTLDEDGDAAQTVKITIDPLPARDNHETLFLVLFEDAGTVTAKGRQMIDYSIADNAVVSLERDLRDTRERLQSMIEEYETALEELKSSNEELVSVNEELQSTNEELEASKEELQSLNEELQTVNMELTGKLDDLDRASGDLRNLFESTQIATVFLDRDLVIRSFTPAVSRIFRLIPSDRGRPLTDLALHPGYPALQDHVRQVFDTGETVEHRIAGPSDEAHYLVRLIPYRDKNELTEGVVITFIDITSLAKAEERQEDLIAALNHRAQDMLTAAVDIARDVEPEPASVHSFREALIGRLNAMAAAYDLIARNRWTDVSIETIVRQNLASFEASRVTIDGPAVLLKPKAGLSIGMVLHELVTNASRHGALSIEAGLVSVVWSIEADARLRLRWSEHGGPLLSPPVADGFGLKLIEQEIVTGLAGAVTIDAHPSGLSLTACFAP